MNDWRPPMEYLCQLVFRRHTFDLKLALLVLVTLIIFVVIFKIGNKALGINRNSWLRIMLASMMALLVPWGAAILTYVYLIPLIPPSLPAVWVIGGVTVLTLVIMIIPLLTVLLRGTSVQVFLAILFSFFALFVSVRLIYGINTAVHDGALSFGKAQSHSDAIKTIPTE